MNLFRFSAGTKLIITLSETSLGNKVGVSLREMDVKHYPPLGSCGGG